MDDKTRRLVACFRTVFGEMPEAEVLRASTSSLAKWDSVASITLVNVIEEEFQMQFDYDLISEMTSFEALSKYVNSAHA